jgi:hypothetical protein
MRRLLVVFIFGLTFLYFFTANPNLEEFERELQYTHAKTKRDADLLDKLFISAKSFAGNYEVCRKNAMLFSVYRVRYTSSIKGEFSEEILRTEDDFWIAFNNSFHKIAKDEIDPKRAETDFENATCIIVNL